MTYDNLLKELDDHGITYIETNLPVHKLKGLYCDNTIFIQQGLSHADKRCILAEELGHYYTSSGDILDYSDVVAAKQERVARKWAAKQLISPEDIIQASKEGIRNRYELAEFLGVTEEFLQESIDFCKDTYGLSYRYKEYTILFEPLSVLRNITP